MNACNVAVFVQNTEVGRSVPENPKSHPNPVAFLLSEPKQSSRDGPALK